MDTGIGLIVAFAAGAFICWVAYRPLVIALREARRRAEDAAREVQDAVEARARAEQDARRVPELLAELQTTRQRAEELQIRLADATARLEAAGQASEWRQRMEQQLQTAFKALAGEILQANAQQFLGQASAQLGQVVDPLRTVLTNLEDHVRHLESQRQGAYQGLKSQLDILQATTTTLAQALKSSSSRGQWGEIQLRRLVELAGMREHVDFAEQPPTEGGRPDLIVRLPRGGVLVVDAKTPMLAFLEAMEIQDEPLRRSRFAAHAKALRQHVQQLASKRYWEQFERAPEVVVLFIPNDGCLAAAFEQDPSLLEEALQQRVLLATPVTLLALLKAVAYGWQQHEVAEHAREIAQHGRQLCARLADFLERLGTMGKRLDSVVKYYNESLGLLESRVMVAARRLGDLGVGNGELTSPPPIERAPRLPLPDAARPGLSESAGAQDL